MSDNPELFSTANISAGEIVRVGMMVQMVLHNLMDGRRLEWKLVYEVTQIATNKEFTCHSRNLLAGIHKSIHPWILDKNIQQ